jgi:hypothetical protein
MALLFFDFSLPCETYSRKLPGKQGITKTEQRNPNDNNRQYL